MVALPVVVVFALSAVSKLRILFEEIFFFLLARDSRDCRLSTIRTMAGVEDRCGRCRRQAKPVAFVENFNGWRNAASLNERLMGMTAEQLMNG